jgi:hypothetical protein
MSGVVKGVSATLGRPKARKAPVCWGSEPNAVGERGGSQGFAAGPSQGAKAPSGGSEPNAVGSVGAILLAEPRGFCAGVDRAIEIVERALQKFGAPIYVRHEIVHNTYVVR